MTSFRASSRTAARVGAVSGALTSALIIGVALAAPVAALERDDGDDPGEPISKVEALLLFGVVPIALMLFISLLVVLPSMVKGNKKTGINWDGQPEWLGGPDEDKHAVEGGGQQALTGTVVSGGDDDGGGSSARW